MKNIRIGARNSPLALWQAREVARHLQNLNHTTEIVPVVSQGDKNLDKPLYAMGITGVFTRDLDQALLAGEIDLAVHSLKDVPTLLPEGIELVACLERDYPEDILVRRAEAKDKPLEELVIATSSLRRRAFWLSQFPNTKFVDIRGNVQTRINKLENGLADATMFSRAGFERLELNIPYEFVPNMLNAPGQGVVAVASRGDNLELNEIVSSFSNKETEIAVRVERNFLRKLEGGCTAPIGARAIYVEKEDKVIFHGKVSSLDGTTSAEISDVFPYNTSEDLGTKLGEELLGKGAKEIMEEIKKQLS